MSGLRKFFMGVCFTLAMSLGSSNIKANVIVTTLDQIVVNLEGIYVNFEGGILPIESLTMANDGYVVAVPRPIAACPRCGCKGYKPGRFCPNCNFPDDGDDFQAKVCNKPNSN